MAVIGVARVAVYAHEACRDRGRDGDGEDVGRVGPWARFARRAWWAVVGDSGRKVGPRASKGARCAGKLNLDLAGGGIFVQYVKTRDNLFAAQI